MSQHTFGRLNCLKGTGEIRYLDTLKDNALILIHFYNFSFINMVKAEKKKKLKQRASYLPFFLTIMAAQIHFH